MRGNSLGFKIYTSSLGHDFPNTVFDLSLKSLHHAIQSKMMHRGSPTVHYMSVPPGLRIRIAMSAAEVPKLDPLESDVLNFCKSGKPFLSLGWKD